MNTTQPDDVFDGPAIMRLDVVDRLGLVGEDRVAADTSTGDAHRRDRS